MGKKINHTTKNRKGDKELQPITRTATINLHRRLYKITFKQKAPKAVKEIKDFARKTMFTQDVRLDPELNQELWRNGVRNCPNKVEVILERKKNEDDEEAKEKLY